MGDSADGVHYTRDHLFHQSPLGLRLVERVIYDRMAEHDMVHWWYVARRKILKRLIERSIALPPAAHILEVGCGTGHSLAMLAVFGRVTATEMDAVSRALASARSALPVLDASLPALDGVPTAHFDLIALLDVLEHVEDDGAALLALRARLAPGGRLLLTVPAHPWMWSGHDVANHHYRRYTRAALRAALYAAGFRIDMLSAFNSLLFPLALADRLAAKITGRQGSDDTLPPAPINALFRGIFGLEAQLVGRVPMTPGLSFVVIASAA